MSPVVEVTKQAGGRAGGRPITGLDRSAFLPLQICHAVTMPRPAQMIDRSPARLVARLRDVLRLDEVVDLPPEALGLQLDDVGVPRRAIVVIDADAGGAGYNLARSVSVLRASKAIVIAVTRSRRPIGPIAEAADLSFARGTDDGSAGPGVVGFESVWVDDPLEAAAEIEAGVSAHPVAAVTLAWLLRGSSALPVPQALTAESVAYSLLLTGTEFRRWRRSRPMRPPAAGRADDGPRIRVRRAEDDLSIVLSRPARRNAVDAAMRDALVEALTLAEFVPNLRVGISGDGPCFSAGGDLDEFGTATELSRAHLVRVQASVGAILHRLADRVTVHVHGACFGAGVELPAFAGHVVAAPGTTFVLPEIAMGLLPGAGGTVSVPRRIGRHRTLWLALTGAALDTGTALEWGLIDAIN
jgi:hypothetical protein